MARRPAPAAGSEVGRLLRHWRETVPDDRLAHLIRDVARAQMRALQRRLHAQGVSFGHWTYLRILWAEDGLTQRELSARAGVMEPTTASAVAQKYPRNLHRQLLGDGRRRSRRGSP